MKLVRMSHFTALALLVSFAVSCARPESVITPNRAQQSNPGSRPQGGEDSGGGETLKSSPELVCTTIKKAHRLIITADSEDWLKSSDLTNIRSFVAPTLDSLFASVAQTENERRLVLQLFPEAEFRSAGEPPAKQAPPVYTQSLSAFLAKSQLELSDSNTCTSSDKDHPDASVPHHTSGSSICFNIGYLTRVSPSALPRDIFALLIHEIAHLKGLNETDAVVIQKLASRVIHTQFSKADAFLGSLASDLRTIEDLTIEAEFYEGTRKSEDPERLTINLSRFKRLLSDAKKEAWQIIQRHDESAPFLELVHPNTDTAKHRLCLQGVVELANASFSDQGNIPQPKDILSFHSKIVETIQTCREYLKGWNNENLSLAKKNEGQK